MGRLRVLVIGNSGCGKTALAYLLAHGKPLAASTTTVGCNTFVKLVEYQDGGSEAPGGRQQSYFVELWDVGTHERYKALRSIFYSQINGVILVHELANGRSTAGLGRWASEVARAGSFAAPLPEDRTASSLGALPVPYLTIANKADLAGKSGRLKRRLPLLCWLDAWLNPAALHAAGSALASKLLRRDKKAAAGQLLTAPSLADMAEAGASAAGSGLTASATEGRVDMQAVDAFFRQLIERRYYAATARAGSMFADSGPVSQGSSRFGGPPAPLFMTSTAAGGYSSGSGPPSGSGSRVTLSNASSLNPAASLGNGGLFGGRAGGMFGGGGSVFGGGGSIFGGGRQGSVSERMSQMGSARIDDVDF